MGSKSKTLIAACGALVYALVGLRLFLSSLASLIAYTPPPPTPRGSGGLGFVTTAIDILVVPFFLLGVASVVANRMLLPWVKKAGSLARIIHHAHTLTIVLVFALPMLGLLAFQAQEGTVSLLFISSGLALGAHFLFAAVLLGIYALQTSSGSR